MQAVLSGGFHSGFQVIIGDDARLHQQFAYFDVCRVLVHFFETQSTQFNAIQLPTPAKSRNARN
jgi:hypothetical protein